MNYFLIKLAFDSAVHFGTSDSALSLPTAEQTFRADTLFSALCHTALSMRGESGLYALCEAVSQGDLLFSDAMPWQKETFFLPKPLLPALSEQEIPTALRKKIKKLAWLPALSMDDYCRSLAAGRFVPDGIPDCFGTAYELTKAAVPDGADAAPYQVGLFRFAPDCGLYFLCACREEGQMEDVMALLTGLGAGGIGGKVSAGYGRFHIEDSMILNEPFDGQTQWLYNALCADKGPYLLLTSSLPKETELDNAVQGASFQLIRRGGFVAADGADTPVKKKTQYFLAAGSVLQNRFEGDLFDVSPYGGRPAYRYAKPLLMGVTL